LQGHQVYSFDYTREFAVFYQVFRDKGLLANTVFLQADALSVAFRPESFDAVVVHDVLYETRLDAATLLARFTPTIRPGGIIYFDFMNAGTKTLWRLLGKERAYRRYRPADMAEILSQNGLELLETRPHVGAHDPIVRLFHAGLWWLFRTSNTIAMVARRREPA
jgi:SAM-dependent methyltransferase